MQVQELPAQQFATKLSLVRMVFRWHLGLKDPRSICELSNGASFERIWPSGADECSGPVIKDDLTVGDEPNLLLQS